MADPFDPFSLDDDAFETSSVNTSQQSDLNRSNQQQNNDSTFFDSSFQSGTFPSPLDETFGGHAPVVTKKSTNDLNSDIFSQLFMSPSQVAAGNNIITKASATGAFVPSEIESAEIGINVLLHEQMSVIYDSEPNSTPTIDVKGTINIKPSAAVEGRIFYIALADPDRHLQQVTSSFEVAKEVTDHLKEEHPFVKRNQEQGNRIYRVEVPQNLEGEGSEKLTNLIKYVGSEYLRPIPLVRAQNCIISTHA
jgi:hypothetical protein